MNIYYRQTVEWYFINNDSVILRLIVLCWVFTIFARVKPMNNFCYDSLPDYT